VFQFAVAAVVVFAVALLFAVVFVGSLPLTIVSILHLPEEEERSAGIGWRAVGRGGSVRRRDFQEPTRQQMPTMDEVDTRDSPRSDNRKDSISLIDFSLEEPRQGRVVDIAQDVF
jgi:uncharacterized protein (DUF58 family)